jgi:hypothetical protein
MNKSVLTLATTSFITLTGSAALAEIAVSANDGKMVLENGVAMVRKAPLPDTISIIEMAGASPRINCRTASASKRRRSAAKRRHRSR